MKDLKKTDSVTLICDFKLIQEGRGLKSTVSKVPHQRPVRRLSVATPCLSSLLDVKQEMAA